MSDPRDAALGDDPKRRCDFYICSFFLYDSEGFGSGHKLWRRWTLREDRGWEVGAVCGKWATNEGFRGEK